MIDYSIFMIVFAATMLTLSLFFLNVGWVQSKNNEISTEWIGFFVVSSVVTFLIFVFVMVVIGSTIYPKQENYYQQKYERLREDLKKLI